MQQTHIGFMLFSIAAGIIGGLWSFTLARDRHHGPWPYLLLGFALPLVGVCLAFALPRRREPAPWRA